MAKNKTAETNVSVDDFLSLVDDEQKLKDSYRLIELMREHSGYEPKMWGPSIIGFGTYHYRYESGHEGDAPILGFSPRKAAISLYIYTGLDEHQYLLEDLGKYKIGKACIYVRKLADINEKSMVAIMQKSIEWVREKYIVEE